MPATATVAVTKRHHKIAKRVKATSPKPIEEMSNEDLMALLGLTAATADLDEDTDDSDDDDAPIGGEPSLL